MTAAARPAPGRGGLSARLLAAQLLVLLAAGTTAVAVAVLVGPAIFHDHLGRVDPADAPGDAARHAEQAFRDAGLVAGAAGLLAAVVVAVVVSVWVTRRVTAPVTALAEAASDVAAGRYDVAVPAPALGAEFDSLAGSFTAMAGRLSQVEATRRRMLADLAHEMRTPVATLDAYLEGLEDGVAALDAETAAVLRAQTRRLARLARDVTAVSRAEEHALPLDVRLLPVAEVVAAAAAAAADRFAAAGVQLGTTVATGLPPVAADPERMAQVLGNLLDNALRHTPRGGRVDVSAAADGTAVVLTVTDTGSGVAAEHLPHLFERFYRVDGARDRGHGGAGIGLAIVKALVEAHHGRVAVTSGGTGAGAAFAVRLPAAADMKVP